jgi:sterol 3beta-glucosyltransferase
MNVVFLTLGTRGDVQPFVALGKQMLKHGHKAVICTGVSFKNFVMENGLEFYPASSDLMALLKTPKGSVSNQQESV